MAPPAPRVILIEDVVSVQDVFRPALARAGFEVDTATTATHALDLLADRAYAAIVADCLLPDLPPLDWLAALRGAAPATPLILASGTLGADELAGLARDFRAVTVLQKPFLPGELVAAVRGALGQEREA